MNNLIEHPFFGLVDLSTGLWEWERFPLGSRHLAISLWDAERTDLETMQAFLENLNTKEKCCFEYLKTNQKSILGLAYSTWSETEAVMMNDLFGCTNHDSITPEMTWGAIELRSIDLFHEQQVSIRLDFEFTNVKCDYVVCFVFDADGEIISADLES